MSSNSTKFIINTCLTIIQHHQKNQILSCFRFRRLIRFDTGFEPSGSNLVPNHPWPSNIFLKSDRLKTTSIAFGIPDCIILDTIHVRIPILGPIRVLKHLETFPKSYTPNSNIKNPNATFSLGAPMVPKLIKKLSTIIKEIVWTL